MKTARYILPAIAMAALVALGGCDKPYTPEVERNEVLNPETMWAYELEGTIDSGFTQLHGVDIGPDGRLYLSGTEGVRVVDRSGEELNSMGFAGPAKAVAFDEEGRMFVGLNPVREVQGPDGEMIEVGELQVLSPEGELVRAWDSWEYDGRTHWFRDITDVAWMNGSVYVADGYNKRIYRFSTTGDFMLEIGGEKPDILIMPTAHLDVVPDPDENALYVNNPGVGHVEVRKPNGELGLYWGERGAHAEGFAGCCNPTDIDVMPPLDYFVTAEKGRSMHRVKVYDRGGRMLAYLNQTYFTQPADLGLDTLRDGMDVAAESTERFYVADPGVQKVLVFKRVKGSDEQVPETE
jgi:hypothetical protein